MQLATIIGIAILLFISFSIGVNIALHGILSVENAFQNKFQTLSNEIYNEFSSLSNNLPHKPPRNEISSATITNSIHPDPVSTTDTYPTISITEAPKLNTIKSTLIPDKVEVTSAPRASNFIENAMMSNEYALAVADLKTKLDPGPITSFVNSGGKFPIVMLTCNRPQLLTTTVESLLKVRGVSRNEVVVLQDGAMKEVADIAKENKFKLIQNLKGLRMRGGAKVDGGAAIAQHYKFALTSAFDAFPDAPAVIIVEDDLLFSPDFYEYMHQTAPILDNDKSVMLISAWNDNGFINKVRDPFQLRRTEYFPGLGWLLPRKLYKEELEVKWPTEHWDHWLRSRPTHKGREIVPRTYHNGIKGTFMTLDTHNKYFRDIAYNTRSDIAWSQPHGHGANTDQVFLQAIISAYESRIASLISNCHHVNSIYELFDKKIELYCIWIDVAIDGSGYGPPEFESIAGFFGIWHEHRRGGHRGLHEFYWDPEAATSNAVTPSKDGPIQMNPDSKAASYILLLNIKEDAFGGVGNYKMLMPQNARVWKSNDFNKRVFNEAKRRNSHIEGHPASKPGMNCIQVCSEVGLTCRKDLFAVINTCPALSEKFSCQECISSVGAEQPAFVNPKAEHQYFPGRCLVSTSPEMTTCESSHKATFRLCPCA